MSINALINSLESQSQNLRNFLLVVKSKQEALVHRDLDGLELSLESEERFILRIDKEEKNRIRIIKKLLNEYSLNQDDTELLKLPNFIEEAREILNDEIIAEIRDKQLIVRELTESVVRVNHQNQYLIHSAKSLIKEIISVAVGDQKKSIIDRKI